MIKNHRSHQRGNFTTTYAYDLPPISPNVTDNAGNATTTAFDSLGRKLP